MDSTGLTVRQAARFFLAVFAFTLIEGVFVRQVLLPHLIPSLHAGLGFMTGDSIGYHEFAVEIVERIRLEGWGAWQLRPGSEIFTLATPAGIASAIYAIFGPNPLFLLPLNAAVHAASALLLLVTLHALLQNKFVSGLATLPFIFFATAISWHSQLSKDGIFILGIYAYLASWMMVARTDTRSIRQLLLIFSLASAGLLIVWSVRTYMVTILTLTTVVGGGFLMLWTVSQSGQRGGAWRRFFGIAAFSAGLLAVAVAINMTNTRPAMTEWTGQEVNNSVYSGRSLGVNAGTGVTDAGATVSGRTCRSWTDSPLVPSALSRLASKLVIVRGGYYDDVYAGAGSTIDRDICITSFYGLIAFIPRALQVGFLAPFPNQWIESKSHGGGVSRMIVGFEMVFTYFALLALVLLGWRFWRRPEFWLLFGFSLSMILMFSVVTPNVGALHRMRYGFLMLLVGMGLGAVLKRFRFKELSNDKCE